ncbi:hypothetical protein ACFLU4_08395, partial [Chloroflexota bacterium]
MREQPVGIEIETDETRRRLGILKILIYGLSVALLLLLAVALALRIPATIASLYSIIGALVACGLAYWLARAGKLYPAAYLFLAGFIIVANISSLLPDAP